MPSFAVRTRTAFRHLAAAALLGGALTGIAPAGGIMDDGGAGADSTAAGWTHIPDLVVSGEAAAPPAPGRATLSAPVIALQDPGSLADIGGLLPSVRVAVNSRGESTLMIRGAPERHVQTFLDGIPLNVPWDERIDLESIPITGSSRLEGRRGLTSLLEGPGVLAGSVRILPPDQVGDGAHTVTSASLGDHGLTRLSLSRQAAVGPWHLLGSGGWQNRDAWPMPAGHPLAAAEELRRNSDLDQYSLLLRAGRPVAGSGRLTLLAGGWHQKKGVPPELHMGEDARYWRYPVRIRALTGASLILPLDDAHRWDLSAMAAFDVFEQEIDPRGPDGWGAPLVDGQDYEQDFDRTGHAVLGLTHWLGDTARLTLQTNARYAHHRESLVVGGGTAAFAQWLTAVVLEGEFQPAAKWNLRAGAGVDRAATPETGDKPARGADRAAAWNLRLSRTLGPDTHVFAAASVRSRFPSLRELYSGALGKFVPNPDLRPERQDLLEIGASTGSAVWTLETGLFLQDLRDGIEKETIPDSGGRFIRSNRTRIRVPGWEAAGWWRPVSNLEFGLQHTILAARVKAAGEADAPAEDRPDYLSRFSVGWRPGLGPGARLEATLTGPRWSADASGASDATGGLHRLPAGVTWNARLAWIWLQDGREIEAHLRADNLFDQLVESQVGLPEPGRVLSGGLRISI